MPGVLADGYEPELDHGGHVLQKSLGPEVWPYAQPWILFPLKRSQYRFLARVLSPGIRRAALSLPRGNGKSWLAGYLASEALRPGGAPSAVPGDSFWLSEWSCNSSASDSASKLNAIRLTNIPRCFARPSSAAALE